MVSNLEPNLDFDKQTSKINNKLIKTMEKVKINKAEVIKLLEQGITKTEVRDQLYPSLNDAQWKKALKAMNLSSYKVKKFDFIIEDPEPTDVENMADRSISGENPAFTTVE